MLHIGLGFAIFNILTNIYLFFLLKKQNKKTDKEFQDIESTSLDQKQKIIKANNSARQLQNTIKNLVTYIQKIEQKINQNKQKIENSTKRQEVLEKSDPNSRLYSRATRLIELGADVNEVMQECQLPRAEAELLLTLYKHNHA